ncbi:hypothetical protein [Paraburkholderia pallida]|uniref:hypothetical protein n=1 Tax=Paraburkholderia pallida TaxID=2547399 RepID=UPI001431BCC0|nr:hypothetical protein [Paraburkholderia pallida]
MPGVRLEGVDDSAPHASDGTAGTDVRITRQIALIRDTLSSAARRTPHAARRTPHATRHAPRARHGRRTCCA